MTDPVNPGLQQATVEQLQSVIYNTCVIVAKRPEYIADLTRLRCTVVDGAYPPPDDAETLTNLGPQHTVSVGFSLGFLAGMLDDASLASTYEVLLRVLEALGLQGLVYGMVRPPVDYSTGPYFIVQIPSTSHQYLKYDITLD